MSEALAERGRERDRLIALAADYVARLEDDMAVVAAAVVGSVARGDFNVWSDVDVVVVSDHLPARAPERGLVLVRRAPPGIQPIGFTRAEFRDALRRANPLAVEAASAGVVLRGETFFRGSE